MKIEEKDISTNEKDEKQPSKRTKNYSNIPGTAL